MIQALPPITLQLALSMRPAIHALAARPVIAPPSPVVIPTVNGQPCLACETAADAVWFRTGDGFCASTGPWEIAANRLTVDPTCGP